MWTTTDCPHCGKVIELEIELRRMVPNNVLLQHPTDFCDWTVRTENVFKMNDITTIGQLLKMSEADLLRLPNFGRVSLREVTEQLASKGLRLGMQMEP